MTGYTNASMVIRILDGEERDLLAGIADTNNSIFTLLLDNPLNAGTRLLMNADSARPALGEVTDWEWDYCGVMARVHIKLTE